MDMKVNFMAGYPAFFIIKRRNFKQSKSLPIVIKCVKKYKTNRKE